MLEVIAEGARNVSLFDVLRWWSYEQDRGAVLAHWYDAVRDHALQHNERFPAPLPAWEVRRLAYNVASWTWSGPGAIDHPPVAQRRRGAGPGRGRGDLASARQRRARGITGRKSLVDCRWIAGAVPHVARVAARCNYSFQQSKRSPGARGTFAAVEGRSRFPSAQGPAGVNAVP